MSSKQKPVLTASDKFEFSEEADALAKQILSAKDESLSDAGIFSFKIIIVDRKSWRDYAGLCWKQSPIHKFLLDTDFLILIKKDYWLESKFDEKAKLLIHELHHIASRPLSKSDKENRTAPKPATRRHAGDFCEIPEHDMYSIQTLDRIRKKMGWKSTIEN